MAQREADAELIKAHLQPYLEKLVCPICGSTSWEVGGPVAEVSFPMTLGGITFPLAFLVCSTCAYVIHFSWERLKRDASKKNG
jgi:hypothetical protein